MLEMLGLKAQAINKAKPSTDDAVSGGQASMVTHADVVIEAVPENLDLKKKGDCRAAQRCHYYQQYLILAHH